MTVLVCGVSGPATLAAFRLVRHIVSGREPLDAIRSWHDGARPTARDFARNALLDMPATGLTMAGLVSQNRIPCSRNHDLRGFLAEHGVVACHTHLDQLPGDVAEAVSHVVRVVQPPLAAALADIRFTALLHGQAPSPPTPDMLAASLLASWISPLRASLAWDGLPRPLSLAWDGLVADPRATATRLADQLGQPVPDDMDAASLARSLGLGNPLEACLHGPAPLLPTGHEDMVEELSSPVRELLDNSTAQPVISSPARKRMMRTIERTSRPHGGELVNVVWIPARSGSSRLPHKNVMLLGELPLLAYAVLPALGLEGVDRVIVDTDSEEYAALARSLGAAVHLRPPELATRTASITSAACHCLEHLLDQGVRVAKWMHLYPTSPFRNLDALQSMVNALDECERVQTVLEVDIPLQELARRDSPAPLGPELLPGLPPLRPSRNTGYFQGVNFHSSTNAMELIFLDHPLECLDIDTREDFEAARWGLANIAYDFGWLP